MKYAEYGFLSYKITKKKKNLLFLGQIRFFLQNTNIKEKPPNPNNNAYFSSVTVCVQAVASATIFNIPKVPDGLQVTVCDDPGVNIGIAPLELHETFPYSGELVIFQVISLQSAFPTFEITAGILLI